MLLNSKCHIDRRRAEVNMIKFTVQSHSISTETCQQLFYYKINVCYAFPVIFKTIDVTDGSCEST